jgi:hypothetical protein
MDPFVQMPSFDGSHILQLLLLDMDQSPLPFAISEVLDAGEEQEIVLGVGGHDVY